MCCPYAHVLSIDTCLIRRQMACPYTHVLCIYTCLVHIHMSCPYTYVLSLYTCVFRIYMSCPQAHVYRKTWSRLLSLLLYSFLRLSVHFFYIGVLSVLVICYVVDLCCLACSIMVKRPILQIVLCTFSFGHCIVCPSIYGGARMAQ